MAHLVCFMREGYCCCSRLSCPNSHPLAGVGKCYLSTFMEAAQNWAQFSQPALASSNKEIKPQSHLHHVLNPSLPVSPYLCPVSVPSFPFLTPLAHAVPRKPLINCWLLFFCTLVFTLSLFSCLVCFTLLCEPFETRSLWR